uniref:Lysosomal Pro-X carboxypeptidase n=1 Tax=Aceria tosichella TaxID=561515 RepID=A0A6G1S9G8_9ACAR
MAKFVAVLVGLVLLVGPLADVSSAASTLKELTSGKGQRQQADELHDRLSITSNTIEDAKAKSKQPTPGQHNHDQAKNQKITINYETRWFRQLVDHFTWANQDTWLQRYLINKDNWCGPNCPILFYTGNEGDIEVFTNNTGWMWENAQQLHAMLVFAEHRFYGQSMPYKIDPTLISPKQTKTLGYLSSEQALADYAKLIYELKHNIFDAKHSPVITLGGSYGGMLAAWMRMKYPNLVDGALAGSAPILQFPGEYNCQDFNKIVTKDYEGYSSNCSRSIAKSWSTIRDYGASRGSAGLSALGRHFNTCQPMKANDTDLLLEMLNSIWVNMAMTDYANKATFLSDMPAHPIEHACAHLKADPIDSGDEDLLAAISRASQVYTNSTGQNACLNITDYVYDPMDVLWDFQSCTEMVMPICSDGINDMFEPEPFNLTDFVQSCKIRWGVDTQVNKIKTLYGDKNLHSASNIIFSSCTRDPWSAGCPQESIDANQIIVLKCPGAHHEDLRPSGPNDSDEMRQVRKQELDTITNWIQKHYSNVRKFARNETLVWASRRTDSSEN